MQIAGRDDRDEGRLPEGCILGVSCSDSGRSHRPLAVQRQPQLKTIQEVVTLVVFSILSVLYLQGRTRWDYRVGFDLMVDAVRVIAKEC
jgi:Putative member of DMT superfamily (DUF486)